MQAEAQIFAKLNKIIYLLPERYLKVFQGATTLKISEERGINRVFKAKNLSTF